MPALSANSDVRGVSIAVCSHITNESASAFVRACHADITAARSYIRNMARRGKPSGQLSWYLPEWMAARGLSGRGSQARMMELTGWSKATMSQLYNGTQDYNPKILAEAARALNAETFELLMPPERAMQMRRFQDSAIKLAAETQTEFKAATSETDRLLPKDGTHG